MPPLPDAQVATLKDAAGKLTGATWNAGQSPWIVAIRDLIDQ
jgi:hypothetical protein